MLIRRVVLDRIVAGEIDLLFRRQKRPTVRTGGTLRTAVGMLDIVAVERVEPHQLTPADARRSGHSSVDELVAELTTKADGDFYRVQVRPGGPDPRIALRDDDRLGERDVEALRSKLARLDSGQDEPWTAAFLRLIDERPHVRAPDLAASLGWDTVRFKAHVRKLKALGLTISHSPGYELSPRGRALLGHLDHG